MTDRSADRPAVRWWAPIAALGVALAVVAAACGDGDAGSDSPAALVDALANDLLEGRSETVNEDDARCAARDLVDAVGEDRLAEAGITAEAAGDVEIQDVDAELQEAAVDAMVACVDLRAMFIDGFGIELSASSRSCISDSLTDDDVREIAFVGIRGEDLRATELGDRLIPTVLGCLTTEEFGALGGGGDRASSDATATTATTEALDPAAADQLIDAALLRLEDLPEGFEEVSFTAATRDETCLVEAAGFEEGAADAAQTAETGEIHVQREDGSLDVRASIAAFDSPDVPLAIIGALTDDAYRACAERRLDEQIGPDGEVAELGPAAPPVAGDGVEVGAIRSLLRGPEGQVAEVRAFLVLVDDRFGITLTVSGPERGIDDSLVEDALQTMISRLR